MEKASLKTSTSEWSVSGRTTCEDDEVRCMMQATRWKHVMMAACPRRKLRNREISAEFNTDFMKTHVGPLHYEIAKPLNVLQGDDPLPVIDTLRRAYSPLSIIDHQSELTRGKPSTPHSS